MCAPVTVSTASIVSSSSMTTALLVNQVIALAVVIGVIGFKFFKALKCMIAARVVH